MLSSKLYLVLQLEQLWLVLQLMPGDNQLVVRQLLAFARVEQLVTAVVGSGNLVLEVVGIQLAHYHIVMEV